MEAARRRLKNELENADFSDVQSETLSHIIANLATKADLQLLRSEMKGLAASLRGEMAEFRGEMRGELSAFRAELLGEMRSEFAELRGEMRSEISGLRGDMCSEISGLRGERRSELSELRGDMGSMYSRLETQITKASSKTQRLMIGLIIALGAIFTMVNIISHFAG